MRLYGCGATCAVPERLGQKKTILKSALQTAPLPTVNIGISAIEDPLALLLAGKGRNAPRQPPRRSSGSVHFNMSAKNSGRTSPRNVGEKKTSSPKAAANATVRDITVFSNLALAEKEASNDVHPVIDRRAAVADFTSSETHTRQVRPPQCETLSSGLPSPAYHMLPTVKVRSLFLAQIKTAACYLRLMKELWWALPAELAVFMQLTLRLRCSVLYTMFVSYE